MTQKEKAIECLQELDLYCYSFIRGGKVPVFDTYRARQPCVHEGLVDKIVEVEKQYGCFVYAVTHEIFTFGECFSMLIVPKYEEDWSHCLRRIDTYNFSAFAYVWNKTNEECSEFGHVRIIVGFGGIMRIG